MAQACCDAFEELPYHQKDAEVSTTEKSTRVTSAETSTRLIHLPPEVQTSVISWVLNPSHLARVCLVSKQLHDIAMPLLYQSLFLNVDRWDKDRLRSVLKRGHRGHRYIRALDIDSEKLEQEAEALKIAKDALQVLPRNCLQSFRCPLETGIDNDLMLAKGLFEHIGSGSDPQVPELNDINFQNQDFSTFTATWLRFIDFTKLRTLQIWNCDNVDHLLLALRDLATAQPMRLHGLVLSFESANQAPTLVEEFLSSFSGLQYVNLCYVRKKPHPATFDIRCLVNSRHSLKDLYLGIGSNATIKIPLIVLSCEDLMWLSSNCPNLRQLAVALPMFHLDDALVGRWGGYGDALLDIIATSIAHLFQGQLRQSLSAITLGNAEPGDVIYDTGYGLYPIAGPINYKVRNEQTGFGSLIRAERIEARLMEYAEPIAYVVDEDTDQGLSLEAYSWGSGS
ncbi:hypothetical protein LTR37_015421 [Vermiconidia calcicola]|uniref:Uncharacterized protein n=1 Tax=Vermiconidia calcicola TaxID=1690605 RepID=A0ACC3MQQ9_9PEZI|nr:hypothetical protein LTR37_015421 [Vermiconidia calcicola]